MKYLTVLLILIVPCIASSDVKGQIRDIKDKLEQAKHYDKNAEFSERLGSKEFATWDREKAQRLRDEAEEELETLDSNIGSDDE